ncbi:MAG: hypothetical protein AB1405_12365, partial [Bdellovibrionota bacterium]
EEETWSALMQNPPALLVADSAIASSGLLARVSGEERFQGLSVLIIGTGEAKTLAGLKVEYALPSAAQNEVRDKVLRLVRGGAESPKAA